MKPRITICILSQHRIHAISFAFKFSLSGFSQACFTSYEKCDEWSKWRSTFINLSTGINLKRPEPSVWVTSLHSTGVQHWNQILVTDWFTELVTFTLPQTLAITAVTSQSARMRLLQVPVTKIVPLTSDIISMCYHSISSLREMMIS